MKFCGLGGRILRGSLMHINPLLEGGTKLFSGGGIHDPLPEALIVCTGISSRFLGGVEDKDVYPIRGQTVLIRAPWVRFGRTEYLDDSGACTYIIPRRSSDVCLISVLTVRIFGWLSGISCAMLLIDFLLIRMYCCT